MRKIVPIAFLCFLVGASAQAVTGWRTFAAASDSGDYGAYASADASVLHPAGLAVRASKPADVSWTLSCDGETKQATARMVIPIDAAHALKCRVYSNASSDGKGTLRIELLRR